MAQTPDGTWVVQNALDAVSDDSSRLQLVQVELLSVDQIKRMCDSLVVAERGLRQHQVGRRLLRMLLRHMQPMQLKARKPASGC